MYFVTQKLDSSNPLLETFSFILENSLSIKKLAPSANDFPWFF